VSKVAPPDNAKSELFRALGHPVRIRVLELLHDGPKTVRHLLDSIAIEDSGLSHQLAVLRGTGLVVVRRDGDTAEYSLGTGEVAELLSAAHRVVISLALGQGRLPAELRVEHTW
jgi:ArsR family transcriptional regulator